MPGAAWWIEGPDGRSESGFSGHAVLEPAHEPLRIDTPFDLASLTKPLCSGLLLALLEQQGRLDAEEPAERLLPELAGSAYAGVSLAWLAAHASGLPAWRPFYLEAAEMVFRMECQTRVELERQTREHLERNR